MHSYSRMGWGAKYSSSVISPLAFVPGQVVERRRAGIVVPDHVVVRACAGLAQRDRVVGLAHAPVALDQALGAGVRAHDARARDRLGMEPCWEKALHRFAPSGRLRAPSGFRPFGSLRAARAARSAALVHRYAPSAGINFPRRPLKYGDSAP